MKGRHLDAAVRRRRPRRCLELGSFLGYSAARAPRDRSRDARLGRKGWPIDVGDREPKTLVELNFVGFMQKPGVDQLQGSLFVCSSGKESLVKRAFEPLNLSDDDTFPEEHAHVFFGGDRRRINHFPGFWTFCTFWEHHAGRHAHKLTWFSAGEFAKGGSPPSICLRCVVVCLSPAGVWQISDFFVAPFMHLAKL